MQNTLLMPFLDESNSYTNGFEVGLLWEKMSNGETFSNQLIHDENVDQIKLMCDHFGYEYSITSTTEDWAYLTASPVNISALIK